MPFEYSQGINSSKLFVLRKYGGRTRLRPLAGGRARAVVPPPADPSRSKWCASAAAHCGPPGGGQTGREGLDGRRSTRQLRFRSPRPTAAELPSEKPPSTNRSTLAFGMRAYSWGKWPLNNQIQLQVRRPFQLTSSTTFGCSSPDPKESAFTDTQSSLVEVSTASRGRSVQEARS